MRRSRWQLGWWEFSVRWFQIAVLPMFHPGQHLALSQTVALELIRNEHPGYVLAPFQQLPEEFLRGPLVAAALHQDIQHLAVLIHGLPAIVALAIDREKDLIKMPCVTGLRPPIAELNGILLAKFATPLPNRFVRDNDATGKQQLFDIPIAEAEAEVQPDTMADDLGRKAMILVAVGEYWCIHPPSISHLTAGQQVDNAALEDPTE
jgi:hypothetical protein